MSVVLALLLLLAGCSHDESYPDRPIELVCPWSAGGGTDRVARQIAHQLEHELGTPVNVVNATGGNGVTGHTRGAMAKPDGYTLSLLTVELNILHWRGLTNLKPGDFTPLCLLNRDAAAIFVRSDAPYQTIHDLESTIRNATTPLKVTGTSQGGVWHVATVGWLAARGIDPSHVNWISIAGSAPSLQELLAGGVDFVCCSVAEAKSLIDAGQVRCLGIMGEEDSTDAVSFSEAGIEWSMTGWRGMAAPVGIAPARKAKLEAALEKISHSDEFRKFMDQAGFNLVYANSETFTKQLNEWDQSFGQILSSDAFATVQRPRFGPMFFPGVIGGGLVIVVLILMLTGGLRLAPDAIRIDGQRWLRLSIVPMWVVIYALVAPEIGFIVTVGTLLLMTMLVLKVPMKSALLVSVLVVPLTYQLFAVILHVSLPWGWIGW